eukprot:6781437-Alexandrium_andersonii.AAC.1
MHALNHAVGRRAFEPKDMELAWRGYLREAEMEGSLIDPHEHASAGGWYSSEVMAFALRATALRKLGRVEHTL